MSKTITPFTAQLVTFDTDVPFAEVSSRLSREINKPEKGSYAPQLMGAPTREAITETVDRVKGPSDFLYFSEFQHYQWLTTYTGIKYPATITYVIGNPIIAETMLKHDLRAGLWIPPRLTLLEKEDGKGTQVVYHLPSSLVAISDDVDEELAIAVMCLDEKLEQLVVRITSK